MRAEKDSGTHRVSREKKSASVSSQVAGDRRGTGGADSHPIRNIDIQRKEKKRITDLY